MVALGTNVSSSSFEHLRPPTATTTACVTASTGINSLSVALGSTFGAFLALGVIVAFVLIAKYQYIRRKRKSIQVQLLQRCDDSMDSVPAAVTRNDDDEDTAERPTINGTIEMKRLSRQPTLGRVPDDDDVVVDGPAGDDDSRDSDFSADIILHDTVVQATADGCPVSGQGQRAEVAEAADPDAPQRLVLDSATCAGSFILANDEPTGRTYSLLVPITSPAVQPLLAGGDSQAGGPRLLRISGSGASASVGTGGGQSIVRLKLRKHATVDYSSVEEDSGLPPLPDLRGFSGSDGRGPRTVDVNASRTGRAVHRLSVCLGRQEKTNSTEPQPVTTIHKTTTSNRRMNRSLSNDW